MMRSEKALVAPTVNPSCDVRERKAYCIVHTTHARPKEQRGARGWILLDMVRRDLQNI